MTDDPADRDRREAKAQIAAVLGNAAMARRRVSRVLAVPADDQAVLLGHLAAIEDAARRLVRQLDAFAETPPTAPAALPPAA